MSDWGFQYTYKSIKSIEEESIRKNLLTDLENFRKIVLSTFSDTGINLKDLQVINLNLVYILSRQPIYIEHIKKVVANEGIGNFAKNQTILQAFKELKFLPLDGSNIPSLEGDLNARFDINFFAGVNTRECYALTFYPSEGSNGVFTEKSFLESFFDKDVCIFAHYLPDNSSLDLNNTPHPYDFLAIPYEFYIHDLFHGAGTIGMVVPKLRAKQINILTSGEIIKTSYYDILQEDFNKFKENKDFVYTFYQLIHEAFVLLFESQPFEFLSKNSIFEGAVVGYDKDNESIAMNFDLNTVQIFKQDQTHKLKRAYQCTFPLRDYFYSQLLSYIKAQPVEITSLRAEILSRFISGQIYQGMQDIFNNNNLQFNLQDDEIQCIPDTENKNSFFIPTKIDIDWKTMTYSVGLEIIKNENINIEHKDLMEKINQEIILSQSNVQQKYSLYPLLNNFISTGSGLAQLGYFTVQEGSQGIHNIKDLNLAQKRWRENIIDLLESDDFKIIQEVEIEVMEEKVELYKEALKKLTQNLKLEVIKNYRDNDFEKYKLKDETEFWKNIDTIATSRKKFDQYLNQLHKEALKEIEDLSKDFFKEIPECELCDIDHFTSVTRFILDKPSFGLVEGLACLKNCFPFSSSSETKAVFLEFKKNIASISELFKLEKLNSDQQDELRDKLTKIFLNFKPTKIKKSQYNMNIIESEFVKDVRYLAKFRKKFDRYLDKDQVFRLKIIVDLLLRITRENPSFDPVLNIKEIIIPDYIIDFSGQKSPGLSIEEKKELAYVNLQKDINIFLRLFKLTKLNSEEQNELKNVLPRLSPLMYLEQSSSDDYEEYLKVIYRYNDESKLTDIEVR
jgi:hypothetical protein